MTVLEHTARDRVQRVLYFASGIGAVVFGLLLLTGPSGILAARDQVQPWYWWLSVIVVVILPISFVGTAFRVPLRALHAIAITCVAGFLLVQLLWVPAMTGDWLADNGTPWIQGINALPSTLVGVAWTSSAVWFFPLSQLVLVPMIQLMASQTSTWAAVLDGCGALIFCSILTAMTLAVVGAARGEDKAARDARSLAAVEAARRTREREVTRINAIVHDDVMSVLLTASREGAPGAVSASADEALSSIASLTTPEHERPGGYSGPEVVAALRAVPADLGVAAHVDYSFGSCPSVPADAVAALSEALGEAVRNSARHAGDHAGLAVSITANYRGVDVLVTDRGPGFDPAGIDPLRLGIRVSIVDRMATVTGGRGTVDSRPGRGTTVAIGWDAP
ncbi:sensor histidine kinase [Demequina sp. NBRC 110057]|uniref:sensor histidine kinase n=1 Tax=Demequina sp. NBRC 110057 TaxID=1570346 RepID=UPI000A02F7C0|nr:ATP-binding protein [Demequina sp. NBRC 110057]